jgi:hypothetical protein
MWSVAAPWGKSSESHRFAADRNLAFSMRTRNALHRKLSLVQAICHGRKGRSRPGPEQIINSCEEWKICSKRSKVPEEKGQIALTVEGFGEVFQIGDVQLPILWVRWDGFQAAKTR